MTVTRPGQAQGLNQLPSTTHTLKLFLYSDNIMCGLFDVGMEPYDPLTGEDFERYVEAWKNPVEEDSSVIRRHAGAVGGGAAVAGLGTGDPALMILSGLGGVIGGSVSFREMQRYRRYRVALLEATAYSVLSAEKAEALITDSTIVHRYVDGELSERPYMHRARRAMHDAAVAHRLYRPLEGVEHDYELTLVCEESDGEQAFQHFFGRVDDPDAYVSETSLASIV